MRRLNLVGKKFGQLIVKGFYKIRQGNSYWKCKCTCGKESIVAAHHLKKGDVSSCGCLKSHKHAKGQTGLKILYRTYKRNAKNNHRKFDLSLEEFRQITSQSCTYCGIEPSTISKSKCEHSFYKYNGIDRINSNDGYIKGNVTACCKWCNIAKQDKTVEEFKQHVIRMHDFMGLK